MSEITRSSSTSVQVVVVSKKHLEQAGLCSILNKMPGLSISGVFQSFEQLTTQLTSSHADLTALYRKLHVTSRTEAVSLIIKRGFFID